MKLLLKVNSEKTRKRHRCQFTYSSKLAVAAAALPLYSTRIDQSRRTTNVSAAKLNSLCKLLVVLVALIIVLASGIVIYSELYKEDNDHQSISNLADNNNDEHET